MSSSTFHPTARTAELVRARMRKLDLNSVTALAAATGLSYRAAQKFAARGAVGLPWDPAMNGTRVTKIERAESAMGRIGLPWAPIYLGLLATDLPRSVRGPERCLTDTRAGQIYQVIISLISDQYPPQLIKQLQAWLSDGVSTNWLATIDAIVIEAEDRAHSSGLI